MSAQNPLMMKDKSELVAAIYQIKSVFEPWAGGYEVQDEDLFDRIGEVFDWLGLEFKDRAWSDEDLKQLMKRRWNGLR